MKPEVINALNVIQQALANRNALLNSEVEINGNAFAVVVKEFQDQDEEAEPEKPAKKKKAAPKKNGKTVH